MSTTYLTASDLHRALTLRDLSDPAQGQHAMQVLLGQVVSALTAVWACTTTTVRTPPVVAVRDNYDRLGFDAVDVTRDTRYTRYLSPTSMLRSHTSADIPTRWKDTARVSVRWTNSSSFRAGSIAAMSSTAHTSVNRIRLTFGVCVRFLTPRTPTWTR